MSAVVQHASANGAIGGAASVTLGSPVTAGNLIVLGILDLQGEITSLDLSKLSDNLGSKWSLVAQGLNTATRTNDFHAILCAKAPSSGSLTISFSDPLRNITALHVYEVQSGYNVPDQSGFVVKTISGLANADAELDLSTGGATATADELVLAMFLGFSSASFSWAPTFPDTELTNEPTSSLEVFSEAYEVTSQGVVTTSVAVIGSDQFRRIYSGITATFRVASASDLRITTVGVAGAPLRLPYSAQLQAATPGAAPSLWSIVSGSLPSGLTLDANSGVISGTPIVGGNFSFTVQVAYGSLTATKSFTLDVLAGGGGYFSQGNVRPTPRPAAPLKPFYRPR